MIQPWLRGKPLAWDLKILDTYTDAPVRKIAIEAGAAATNKTNKYGQLSITYIFTPVTIETAGDAFSFQNVFASGLSVATSYIHYLNFNI